MADSTVIGVHVAGGVLRRAELVRREGRIEVIRLDAVPFSGEAGEASRVAGGAGAAANGTPGPSLNGSRLVAAMPAGDVMSRCWPLPPVADHRLAQMVANRLEADLPVPMDKLAWGYRPALRAGGGERTVLAQAARSERVGQYMARLAAAGIRVDLLTTEAEALSGLYRHGLKAGGPEPEALLLATPAEWLVCTFAGGLAQAVRRIRVDPERLEGACRECRQIVAGGPAAVAVRRIWCCALTPDPELCQLLADICGVPVEAAEPAEGLTLSDGKRLPAEHLATFGPAIGLALAWPAADECVIRLAGSEHPGSSEPLARLEGLLARPWTWTSAAAVLLALAAAIHVGSLSWQARRMQEAIDRGSASSAALEELEPKLRGLQRLEMYRIDVEGICGDICAAIKDPITISSLQLSREHRLTLKGTSKDPKAIFTFVDDLRKSSRFKRLNLERTAPGQGGDFVISLELDGVRKFSSPGLRGGR